jgi:hypothetical protein
VEGPAAEHEAAVLKEKYENVLASDKERSEGSSVTGLREFLLGVNIFGNPTQIHTPNFWSTFPLQKIGQILTQKMVWAKFWAF